MTTLKPEPPKAPSRKALELLSKYVHHRPGCEPASVDPACVCVEIAREIDALAAERVREALAAPCQHKFRYPTGDPSGRCLLVWKCYGCDAMFYESAPPRPKESQ